MTYTVCLYLEVLPTWNYSHLSCLYFFEVCIWQLPILLFIYVLMKEKQTLFQLPKKFALHFAYLFFIMDFCCFNVDSYTWWSSLPLFFFPPQFWQCNVEANTGLNDTFSGRCILSVCCCFSDCTFFFFQECWYLVLLSALEKLKEKRQISVSYTDLRWRVLSVYLKFMSWCNKWWISCVL